MSKNPPIVKKQKDEHEKKENNVWKRQHTHYKVEVEGEEGT